MAHRSDLQKTHATLSLFTVVTSPLTRKAPLPLLRVGPCLQSCCLATPWSNPLQYIRAHHTSPNTSLTLATVTAIVRFPLHLKTAVSHLPIPLSYTSFLLAGTPVEKQDAFLFTSGTSVTSKVLVSRLRCVENPLYCFNVLFCNRVSAENLSPIRFVGDRLS
jgi:hypothetical protein